MNIGNIVRTVKSAERVRKVALKTAKITGPVTRVGHKYGPEILTGVGIAGGVGTVVLASRATLQLEAIVDITKMQINAAEDEKEARQAKLRGMVEIAKLYGPAAGLGVGSTIAILGAHGIMRKRNVALAAAYQAIEKSFNEYRKRVIAEFGEDKDRDFRYGISEKQVTDKKSGEKKTVATVDPNAISQYARFFDDSSVNWQKTPEYNLLFLKMQQNYWNDMLQARKHVFLNEVYDALGIERSEQGQVVGWVLGKGGDDYIDFGIYDFNNERKREFVNGREQNILLDFNVDGLILDKL